MNRTYCPGCGWLLSEGHAPNCPLGPRARFSLDRDGRVLGTQKRGPE